MRAKRRLVIFFGGTQFRIFDALALCVCNRLDIDLNMFTLFDIAHKKHIYLNCCIQSLFSGSWLIFSHYSVFLYYGNLSSVKICFKNLFLITIKLFKLLFHFYFFCFCWNKLYSIFKIERYIFCRTRANNLKIYGTD